MREKIKARGGSHWPLSISTAATSVINVLLPLVLARQMPAESVGRYKIFFLYLVVAPWFMGSGAIQNGVSYWTNGRHRGGIIVNEAWNLQCLLALSVLGVGLAFRLTVADWLEWPGEETTAFIVAIAATIGATFYEEVCVARGKVMRGALFHGGFELCRTVVVLTAVLVTKELVSLFWAHAAVTAVKALTGLLLGFREGAFTPRPVVRHGRVIFHYALPAWGATLLTIFVTYSDQLILSRFLATGEFAMYAVGCLWIPPLFHYEQSVNRVLIPRLSTALAAGETIRAKAIFRRTVEELAWLLVPAALGLMVFAEPIIRLLFTDKFAGAARFLPLYAVSYLLLALPHDVVPRACGHTRWILTGSGIAAVIAVVFGIALTSRFGPFGALGAFLGSDLFMKLYGLGYLRRKLEWRWSEIFPATGLLRITALALLVSAVALVLRRYFTDDILWFLICAPAIFATFTIAFLGSRMKRHQKQHSGHID